MKIEEAKKLREELSIGIKNLIFQSKKTTEILLEDINRFIKQELAKIVDGFDEEIVYSKEIENLKELYHKGYLSEKGKDDLMRMIIKEL